MFTLSQIAATAIFLAMFIVIIIGKIHRLVPALIGAAFTILIVFLIIEKNTEMVIKTFSLAQLGQMHFWIPGHQQIGGNATPIGASANVVGTAIAEREGYPIGWGRFLKYALPSMILVAADGPPRAALSPVTLDRPPL